MRHGGRVSEMTRPGSRRLDTGGLYCAGAICALVLAAFLPVLGNGFVAYDDEAGIVGHPVVSGGLSWRSAAWALRAVEQANWMPLPRLSHLADVSLFGMQPRGHHAVSLVLHAAAALLLWLFLERATGSRRASFAVALLFALHPLRVESVAWASERKDVLAGLFWMLCLLGWTAYLRRPSGPRYLGVAAFHALGLMAKPSVVTLPIVLLLLDFWPFGRGWVAAAPPGPGPRPRATGVTSVALRRLLEKAPLLAMSAAASVVAYFAQRAGGALDVEGVATSAIRASFAVTAFWGYPWRTLWPHDLSILTMHTMGHEPLGRAIWGGLALAGASVAAVTAWRRHPSLVVGWFWYPVVLLPMSGLVQVGVQGLADRYTYLPLIGPVLAGVWLLRPAAARRPGVALLLGALITVALVTATWRQSLLWRDSVTLFGRAVAVSPGNLLARANLGHALSRLGRLEEADGHYRRVLESFPLYPGLRYRLAENVLSLGNPEGARGWLEEEVRLRPENREPIEMIAHLLAMQGRYREAEEILREQTGRFPGDAPAWSNLGVVLTREGRLPEARAAFEEAVRLDPGLSAASEGLLEIERALRGPPPPPRSP